MKGLWENQMTRFNLSNGLFWVHHTVQTKFYRVQILRWLKHTCVPAKSLQLCLTLCDTLYCSLSGSSVHEILQPRKLAWVAMPFCKGSFQTQGSNLRLLCFLHWQEDSLPLALPRKPKLSMVFLKFGGAFKEGVVGVS